MTVTREHLAGLELAAKYLRDKESENWLGSKGHHTGYIAAAVDLERLAVEAQSAEPVQGEAVEVVVKVWNQGGSGEFRTFEGGEYLPDGTQLYTSPAKPDAELIQILKFARTTMAVTAKSENLREVERRSLLDEVARIDAKLADAGHSRTSA
jgi:hypothetical protein